MPEEFVEDIIAATKVEENSSDAVGTSDANNDAGSESAIGVEDKGMAAGEEGNAGQAISDDKSSSTSDGSAHPNVDDTSGSGDGGNAPTASPEVEELAAQLGWNKDHKGPDAVDAVTYILRSRDIQNTMREHNKDLKTQLSTVKSTVDALKKHNERVYQVEIRKLKDELATLQEEKDAAIQLADVAKVKEIDEKIKGVEKTINAPESEETVIENPLFDEWVADNKWYLTDPVMAKYADAVADQYNGAPPERIYQLVRKKVEEVFPDKFEDAKKTETGATQKTPGEIAAEKAAKEVVAPKAPVESGGGAAPTKGTITKADLTPDQLQIMNQFVQMNVMTEEQYLADVAKLQGE